MAGYDDIGRIPRQAFVISTSLLFALCLFSVCARYYIRIVVQKEFTLDDGFLAFGTACLIAAMGVLYISIDNMYLTEALIYAPSLFATQSPDLNGVVEFRTLVTVSLILMWVAIVAVKFAFLALFRRLIDRFPPLLRYWWFVVIFNLAVGGYCVSIFFFPCPDFGDPRVSEISSCLGGATTSLPFHAGLSQLVLDVTSDLLILYIPCHLIWKIKIKMTQKLTLACCLCLTVVVIAFTITRAGGIGWQGNFDLVWEVYFMIVGTEVGLILASMTAFRQLFVFRSARKHRSPAKSSTFWPRSRAAMRKVVDLRRWTSGYSKDSCGEQQPQSEQHPSDFDERLPSIPGGTMTGVRTFIEHQGGTTQSSSPRSTYPTVTKMDQGNWPLTGILQIPEETETATFHEQPNSWKYPGTRPLESTENDTIASVIGLYQDRSRDESHTHGIS